MTGQQDSFRPFAPDVGESAAVREPRPMYWSVRRELWESRSIYLAPLIVTALVLFSSLIRVIAMLYRAHPSPMSEPARVIARLLLPFSMAPAPIMLTTFLVAMFYCLDALYGERRDRSILFWKSLPVSDRTTVVSKACIPFVVLPTIAFALSALTQLVMFTVSIPFLVGRSVSPIALWAELRFFEGLVIMFYGLAVHTLWFAPIYGWFLLVSAWARRAPILWALVPLLAIAAAERIAFNSAHFISMLQYRVTGAMREAFEFRGAVGHVDRLEQLELARFLSAPGLMVGLMLAVLFIAMAVRVRRGREPN